MSLIRMLAKKKKAAAATAVLPKVTDVTEQPSSSKLPTQAESGKLYFQPDARIEKLIKVSKYVRRKF